MNPVVQIWSQFFFCVLLIGVAGIRLSRHADTIASLTGLSRNWIGLILVATVTSLPELVTGLSSVTVAAAPDIAVGDVLGSCVFNLAILALLDVSYRRGALYAEVSQAHIMSAGFGVILQASAGLAMLLTARGMMPSLAHISAASPLIVALYVLAMRAIYQSESHRPPDVVPRLAPDATLRTALMGYGLASVVIVGAGIWLPLVGVELARVMGWSNSLVGTLFVAFATSVPELATTWGALRLGALDLAIGNLLGSNLFDVLILAVDDFAYRPASLYAAASSVHVVSALTASMMSGAVVVALAYRPVGRVWHIASWASLALLGLYLLHAFVQFLHRV
jgi:cation:H+ antiporter